MYHRVFSVIMDTELELKWNLGVTNNKQLRIVGLVYCYCYYPLFTVLLRFVTLCERLMNANFIVKMTTQKIISDKMLGRSFCHRFSQHLCDIITLKIE